MPVSAAHSQIVFDALKAGGVRLMSALPETWLVHLIRLADDDPDVTLVRLPKEEEGVGISMGAQLYRIPLLMLISDRGTFGERDPWQTEGGAVTESVLAALRIPIMRLDDPAKVAHRVRQALALAHSSNKPVALLLTRDLMWEEA